MVNTDISIAALSDQANVVEDYEPETLQVDSARNQDETEWINSNWTKQWWYFNNVPDVKSAIIMKANWNVGKGYTTDPATQVVLDHITGWGKDTFDDILFNMEIIKRIGGDAYAEIIRDEESGELINLKPLDTGSIKIIVDRAGRIKRYEQINKYPKNSTPIKFDPKDILHLSNNRLADQIHGISDIDAMEETIKADQESFKDTKRIMHRQARPLMVMKVGTDDDTKLQEFINKMDRATNEGENIYVPSDETVFTYEVVQASPSPLVIEWRNDIRNKFYRTIGLPQIVPGGGGQSTESESKVIYLAFEQIVEKEQRQLEKQLWLQLQIRIELYPPATLQQNLASDEQKDAGQGLEFQQGDTTAGVAR